VHGNDISFDVQKAKLARVVVGKIWSSLRVETPCTARLATYFSVTRKGVGDLPEIHKFLYRLMLQMRPEELANCACSTSRANLLKGRDAKPPAYSAGAPG
jgi:hypothetical protein